MKKILCLFLCALLSALAFCQTSSSNPAIPKVACWPSLFTEDGHPTTNQTAIDTAKDAVHSIFSKIGMEWVDEGAVNAVLDRPEFKLNASDKTLPSPADMLKLGQALHSDYVVAYGCDWHSKTIMQLLGLKTKSTCTTTMVIVDVRKVEVIYHPDPLTVDSEKKFSAGEIAGTLLVSSLVTFASGGPKTPHMQRAAQVCIAEVMTDFVKQYKKQQDKISIGG